MTRMTSLAVASFFECISRVFQAFANGPFGRLRPMFHGFPGGFCTMLNRLPCFFRGFLYGLTSFFDWTLILGAQSERNAK